MERTVQMVHQVSLETEDLQGSPGRLVGPEHQELWDQEAREDRLERGVYQVRQELVEPQADQDPQDQEAREVKLDCKVHQEEPDNQGHQDHEETQVHRERVVP